MSSDLRSAGAREGAPETSESIPARPFEDIVRPIADRAHERLLAQLPPPVHPISPRVFTSARNDLLSLLAGLCSRPLLAALRVFAHAGDTPPDAYADFANRMEPGAFNLFLGEYPALRELVTEVVESWIAAYGRFFERIECDRDDLVRTFGRGAAANIAALETSLSDRHGGESVIGVTFDSGLKLAYKPREMALERGYFNLLAWLNDRGAPVPFRTLKVLDRGGYGWVGWVESRPCRDEREIGGYFERAGALQCLLRLLHSTDAHMGNVIAEGAWPVLIDAECLLQPERTDAHASGMGEAFEELWSANFLPRPRTSEDAARDFSGLAGHGGHLSPYRIPRWENGDTERMSLRWVRSERLGQVNTVRLGGEMIEAPAHSDDFVRGYAETYRFLMDRRVELLGGPLGEMPDGRARVLLRATRVYVSIINRSLRPALLRDRDQRAAAIRADLRSDGASLPDAIIEAEAQAIERLDVPYFAAPVRGRSICAESRSGRETVEAAYFDNPGDEILRRRIARFSGDELDRHLSAIRVILALSRIER